MCFLFFLPVVAPVRVLVSSATIMASRVKGRQQGSKGKGLNNKKHTCINRAVANNRSRMPWSNKKRLGGKEDLTHALRFLRLTVPKQNTAGVTLLRHGEREDPLYLLCLARISRRQCVAFS